MAKKRQPRPDPLAPEEGIEWFRERVSIKKKDWVKLEQRMQEKAFTIAGVAQLDLIAKVHEQLVAAQKRGDSFEAFKKKVKDELYKAWGEERPWHVETIFRNANQRAYQAGRRAQLLEPDVLRYRPYLKAEPILDARTTEVCRRLEGVVLLASHPFWRTHWPPLHHNCRTSIRSLTLADAKEEGISKRAPRVKADAGFGGVDPLEWKPDLKAYPPVLVKVYRRGQ